MNQVDTFFELHKGPDALLIGNVWDAGSAVVFEKNGFKALATSSAALADALGYEDGEHLPFELLLETVARIISRVNIPLSVDMERGYSSTIEGIIENADRMHELGVVGINIEDSAMNGERSLQPVETFQRTLEGLSNHFSRKNSRFFINARTDAFLIGHSSPLPETLARARAYEDAGANGLFIPFATTPGDIKAVVESTSLPVHVLYHSQLPPFKELSQLGVRRISMGSSVYRSLMAVLDRHIREIQRRREYCEL